MKGLLDTQGITAHRLRTADLDNYLSDVIDYVNFCSSTTVLLHALQPVFQALEHILKGVTSKNRFQNISTGG